MFFITSSLGVSRPHGVSVEALESLLESRAKESVQMMFVEGFSQKMLQHVSLIGKVHTITGSKC